MILGMRFRRALLGTLSMAFGFIGLHEAGAVSTYNPTSMSCAAIKSTIRANGEVMLRWRSRRTGNPLYGLYVANRGYCDLYEVAVMKHVPASDRSRCPVRKCIPRNFVDDDLCFFGRC